jgi:hypothetical protein
MRRWLTIGLLVVVTAAFMVGAAAAVDPTGSQPFVFTEEHGQDDIPTGNPDASGRDRGYYGPGGYGSSFWSYLDSRDTTAKTEGSYGHFEGPDGWIFDQVAGVWAQRADSLGTYSRVIPTEDEQRDRGPHGGYTTTSNKCKICHAVHRADGAFKLARADSADDACSYCHVGDHRHASRVAYSNPNNSDGVYPANGHSMGAGRTIPASSPRQWLGEFTLIGEPEDEEPAPEWTIRVRRYSSERMKLFVYSGSGSSRHDGAERTDHRYGPTLLTCISCHQPHNATERVWKPPFDPINGYKLLRASPSGSYMANDGSDPNAFTGLVDGDKTIITVPEADFGPDNTGHNLGDAEGNDDTQTVEGVFTTWAQWQAGGGAAQTTETIGTVDRALSVWCADCHNLAVSGGGERELKDPGEGEVWENVDRDGEFHPERWHTSGSYYVSCMSCHRVNGDGGRISGNQEGWDSSDTVGPGTGCNRCHYRSQYLLDNPTNDFPHSGAGTSAKLLSDWFDGTSEVLDPVCAYCHEGSGLVK